MPHVQLDTRPLPPANILTSLLVKVQAEVTPEDTGAAVWTGAASWKSLFSSIHANNE